MCANIEVFLFENAMRGLAVVSRAEGGRSRPAPAMPHPPRFFLNCAFLHFLDS